MLLSLQSRRGGKDPDFGVPAGGGGGDWQRSDQVSGGGIRLLKDEFLELSGIKKTQEKRVCVIDDLP